MDRIISFVVEKEDKAMFPMIKATRKKVIKYIDNRFFPNLFSRDTSRKIIWDLINIKLSK
jgi:hypothetical protein